MRTLLILATFIWAALAFGSYMGGKEATNVAIADQVNVAAKIAAAR